VVERPRTVAATAVDEDDGGSFFDGAYQPERRSPSEASNATASYPLGVAGIGSRYLWVGTMAAAIGNTPT